jgi:hypothetical protein
MQTENSFEVVMRTRIPYLTTFLFTLLMTFAITLVLLSFVFTPAKYQSDEMKVAYFILVVPDVIKYGLFIAGIGFITTLPLYIYLRLYQKATLVFLPETIIISGQKINITIPIERIKRLFCMDSKTPLGESKQKLTLYFERKADKTVRVKLKDYSQADQFMNHLLKYENLNLKFYDFDVNPDSEDNEE